MSDNHFHVGKHKIALRDTQQFVAKVAADQIFNPRPAQRDMKKVMSKYEEAPELLQGIGLTPPVNYSLAKGFPSFTDPTTVYTFPSNDSDDSSKSTNASRSSPMMAPVIAPVSVPFSKLPLTDFQSGLSDILYYGTIGIGTPPQLIRVDVDTGSADLWVASDCPDYFGDQFSASNSTTLETGPDGFSISYGTGDVSGQLAKDAISVAGLHYPNQTLGLANVVSSDFDNYPYSGIMGLAFGTISVSGSPTVFENLMQARQVLAPFFSVYMARGGSPGSEVCFGCYDVTRTTGTISWVPIKSQSYWSVELSGVKLGSEMIPTVDVVAAIDTGTTLIYLPEQVAQAFYDLIPGAQATDLYGPGFYIYPCETSLDMALNFSGKNFTIDMRDFNQGKTSAASTNCVGGIMSLGNDFPDNIAIIGDEFLKSWYSVYDYSNGLRVGFAPSINNT